MSPGSSSDLGFFEPGGIFARVGADDADSVGRAEDSPAAGTEELGLSDGLSSPPPVKKLNALPAA